MSEDKPEYKAEPIEPVIAIPEGARQSHGLAPSEADKRISALEAQLTEKDTALTEAKKALEIQASDFAVLKTTHEAAITAYKKLAISSNPLFSAELISGNTVAEVDVSMQKITDLAGLVRSKIEADIKSVSVPAGAPERSGPDISGLSPREKIKQGLEKK
ncbi:MAG: hypothetical protein PHO26_10045 [Dehalococcoidia bacterium]|nr:hypothetical protein [Dehalococcoidia bacterium]MDD5494277.1 hypothetical protein [Dehalococcoidia bacterium]